MPRAVSSAPTISICVPARDEAATIGPIVDTLVALREAGAVDEVVVADGDSTDGTERIARERGATVCRQAALLPQYGPPLGKGDAIWRSQAALGGDVLCFVDGDLAGLSEPQVLALIEPLREQPDAQLVKSTFTRPFAGEARSAAPDGGGGRVTQLAARPLLRHFYPELCRFGQPLSGQIAIRRELLASLPISTGYAFDIGLLIDAYRRVGLGAIVEVDIGTIQNRHRDVVDLGAMSFEVHAGVFDRLRAEGRLVDDAVTAGRVVERPPFASLSR